MPRNGLVSTNRFLVQKQADGRITGYYGTGD